MQTQYQSIFETSIDGIILITETGIIEDINTAALKLGIPYLSPEFNDKETRVNCCE